MHNKTFIEEESLELYENVNKETNNGGKEEEGEEAMEELSEIKSVKKIEDSFCERLIVKNMEETLRLYEEDREILAENKAFL